MIRRTQGIIKLTHERDRYKALYEYAKSRYEAADRLITLAEIDGMEEAICSGEYQDWQEIKNSEPPCDAMGHFGGNPKPEGECPKCGKKW